MNDFPFHIPDNPPEADDVHRYPFDPAAQPQMTVTMNSVQKSKLLAALKAAVETKRFILWLGRYESDKTYHDDMEKVTDSPYARWMHDKDGRHHEVECYFDVDRLKFGTPIYVKRQDHQLKAIAVVEDTLWLTGS